MNLIRLLPLVILAANFSGRPAPAKPLAVVNASAGITKKSVQENAEIISWNVERKLSWDDFLCAPQKQGDAVASTSTSLGISYQVKNSRLAYSITCEFSKKKSWGSLKTDYILS